MSDFREAEFERLQAENTKLRELCEQAATWMERAMYDGSARKYEYELILNSMRNFGIDVYG